MDNCGTEKQKFEKSKKIHECKYCQKKSATARDLNRHERTHTGEKPHKCNTCEKHFTTSGELISH